MTDDNVRELRPNQVLPPRDERDWATSQELLAEAGITYRQLDYWTRTGLLNPVHGPTPGSGHVRTFPDAQVTRARAIRELLDAGVALTVIRPHVEEFVRDGRLEIGPITITRNPGAAS